MDDRQLVNLVLIGSTESFSLLVDRYYKKILGFICKTGISREDAEDITQEAFIRAYNNLFRYDANWSFSTWIFRIAVNLTKNHQKRRRSGLQNWISPVSDEQSFGEPLPG